MEATSAPDGQHNGDPCAPFLIDYERALEHTGPSDTGGTQIHDTQTHPAPCRKTVIPEQYKELSLTHTHGR